MFRNLFRKRMRFLPKSHFAEIITLILCPRCVFSHESALYLLDMSDREPLKYTVTVNQGYNPSRLKSAGIHVYTAYEKWYDMGLSEVMTPFGHSVRVYNCERTLCDVFRGNSQVEIQDRLCALHAYVRSNKKNLNLLFKYAKELKVEKQLRTYMEVLLE